MNRPFLPRGVSTLVLRVVCLIFLIAISSRLSAQIITTVAGSALKGDGGPATAANLANPVGVVQDGRGNLYIADQQNHRIRKVAASGIITTIAGTGSYGFGGDGGAATAANLANPAGVALDGIGNLYIADSQNHRIRKVTTSGIVSTVAGTGTAGYDGDGAAATAANLNNPVGVAVDGMGNVYIADALNHRIRKVAANGVITTVAGTGMAGFSGDGGAATSANLNTPAGVTVDGMGNFYVSDQKNQRIRMVSTAGIIITVAGTGTAGYSEDGVAANTASLNNPAGLAVDGSGNLYIADQSNHRVRKVSAGGIISTVAGNGIGIYSGDGGIATMTSLYSPGGVLIDGTGNLYIADALNHRIRKVANNGIIATVAGNGTVSYGGDRGPATSASLYNPVGVAFDGTGNFYIADQQNQRIRKVATSGIITTVAGNGLFTFGGDGGAATAANLANPSGVAVDGVGNIYIADALNQRIRKVAMSGIITTVAGNGIAGFSGDGGAATAASLNNPVGVTVDGTGNLYIADSQNNRIRKVATSGIISTVAGNGTASNSGDGGLATAAGFNYIAGVVLDGSGNLYIADQGNHRIRKVATDGIVTTVAGTGIAGYSGDGGLATAANLANPASVVVDGMGNLYIADYGNNRIRKVATNGIITTVAGNGSHGFSGDGGLATAAILDNPFNVAVDGMGNLYISDSDNQRVRKVTFSSVMIKPAGSLAVCSSSPFSLTAVAAGFSPAMYTWTSQPAGFSATGSTPAFMAPVVSTPAVYTLTVTATDGSISQVASATITINPIPGLTITASPGTTVSSGQAVTLTAAGATSYSWSTGAATASVLVNTAGVYSVTGTANGCSATKSIIINVVIASVQSGNWSSAATWNCSCLPTAYDVVTISTGHTVTVSQLVQAQSLKQNGTLLFDMSGKVTF
ncbi:NHL repeat-containing protein [Spirosoma spitsbergense]|uniref:NHL repeat-containing protein n=1 Tax=Spirosoma spitsbergense TaxID=431554 RepID=UPI0004759F9E|nr:NHL repeat-containing protein [Spirosoma spitsbergense]